MPAGRLYLVRHGAPLVDPRRRSTGWHLDPTRLDDVRALRGRLPLGALWFCSPELKARETATLLTTHPVEVVADLREHVRSGWSDDFATVVDRAFADPTRPAADGWESLDDCRHRVSAAVAALRVRHAARDLVLVGHGTAWTVLRAEIAGATAERRLLDAMSFPDLVVI